MSEERPDRVERRRSSRRGRTASLRRQFMIVLVTFSLVFAAVGGWGTWRIVKNDLEAEMDDKLRQYVGYAYHELERPTGRLAPKCLHQLPADREDFVCMD